MTVRPGVSSRYPVLVAGLGVALLVALRVYGASASSLWLDEAIQLDMASKAFPEMWRSLVLDRVHPPLDTLLTSLWRRVSESDAWLRIPPVLWSVATGLVLWVRSGGGAKPVRSSVSLFAFAAFPLAVQLGSEIRPYALGLLSVALVELCRWNWRRTDRTAWWWGAVLASLLAAWSLYWGLFAALLSWGVEAVRSARSRDARRLARSVAGPALVLAGYLPWLIAVARAPARAIEMASQRPTTELVLSFLAGLVTDRQEDLSHPVVAGFLWGLFLLGVLLGEEDDRPGIAFLAAAMSLGVLGALLAAGHWWSLRYLCVALVPLALGAGLGAETLISRAGRWRVPAWAALLVLVVVPQRDAIQDVARNARPDWREVASFLDLDRRSGRGGTVLAGDPWSFIVLRFQTRRLVPPFEPALVPDSPDGLATELGRYGSGWLVASSHYQPSEEAGRLLAGAPARVAFPRADEATLRRFEGGRLLPP